MDGMGGRELTQDFKDALQRLDLIRDSLVVPPNLQSEAAHLTASISPAWITAPWTMNFKLCWSTTVRSF